MGRKQDDGCCNLSCMKVLFMFFNVILMLTGIGIMGVGIWIFSIKNNFNSLLGTDNYIIVPGLMIAAGFLVIFVCIVGCVGVIKENRFILVSYIIMLALIFILEIATGLIAIIYRSQISEELLSGIRGKMNQYGFADDVTEAIDELQTKYRCCGDIDVKSWNTTAWKQSELSRNNTVPDSCCKTFSKHCGVRDHPSNINTVGCIQKLEDYFLNQFAILAGVGIGLGLCQVVFLVAFWYYNSNVLATLHPGILIRVKR